MQVKKILIDYNIKPRKRLGQNFLVSQKYLKKIVEYSSLDSEDIVVEIGAGIGNLTELLLGKVSKVIAVEQDGRLVSVLKELLGENKKLEILNKDFLKVDIKNIAKDNIKIIGNPPYYFSSRLIGKLIADRMYFNCACLSFQKEYVERMIARAGSKIYGRLSVFVQSFFECHPLFKIPRSAFYPPPDVDSIFVKLVPRKGVHVNPALVEKVTREIFTTRRKKLSSIIRNSKLFEFSEMKEILEQLNINLNDRPESISIEKFHAIIEILAQKRR
jgi:16S rRNA (adenine1518-N6/adenine1519-N6)-dimethyltransferase